MLEQSGYLKYLELEGQFVVLRQKHLTCPQDTYAYAPTFSLLAVWPLVKSSLCFNLTGLMEYAILICHKANSDLIEVAQAQIPALF